MKKYLGIAALLLLVINHQSFALLKMGLKAGVNLANVEASGSDVDYSLKPGFMAGAMAEIPVSPGGLMAARAELLYVQKGAETSYREFEGELSIEEFVFAPFLIFYFPSAGIQPFLEAGPEFGLNTLAKAETENDTRSITQDWKDNNFSINLGGGLLVPAGKGDLVIDARYNLGLSDMTLGGGSIKTKTNGIQFFLGYNFFKL